LQDSGEGPWIRIRVSDTGVGIPQERKELVFQEFAQAGESTQKKYGGYGLGLTISKKLTELLGGTLYLESEVGRGSSFTFRLPVEHAETPQQPQPSDAPGTISGPLSLYVVDDDGTLLELLAEICHTNYIQVKTFNGYDALIREGDLE